MLPITGIDYFDTRRHNTLRELLAHAEINYRNIIRFARLGRISSRDRHRFAEIAIENKAHFHSILARAAVLPYAEDGDLSRLGTIHRLFAKSRKLKV
jgi:hypothetical protein